MYIYLHAFIKVKKHVFYVCYLQINVHNIYAANLTLLQEDE